MVPLNQLQLHGQIVSPLQVRHSPAGIQHAEFWFSHQSTQYEGSLQRQAYCKIRTVVAGDLLQQYMPQLQENAYLRLMGFLHQRQLRSGAQEMVFYVQLIELSKENM